MKERGIESSILCLSPPSRAFTLLSVIPADLRYVNHACPEPRRATTTNTTSSTRQNQHSSPNERRTKQNSLEVKDEDKMSIPRHQPSFSSAASLRFRPHTTTKNNYHILFCASCFCFLILSHLLTQCKMKQQADWASFEGIVTGLLEGSPIAILVTALIAFGLPVLLHFIFYRTVASPPLSNFLFLGPSGSGKTALVSLVGSLHSPISLLFFPSRSIGCGRED